MSFGQSVTSETLLVTAEKEKACMPQYYMLCSHSIAVIQHLNESHIQFEAHFYNEEIFFKYIALILGL